MGFKRAERTLQIAWKRHTAALSDDARRPGLAVGGQRSQPTRDEMFLHEAHAEENLLPATRQDALHIFQDAGIDWHEGAQVGSPSNYLMDSMVACVNCLLPFAHDGRALAALLRPIVPEAVEAEPIERGRVLTFEWLGVDNPLREPSRQRKRGSRGTSADAFCVLRRSDGGRTGVLIEWKYTESYPTEKAKYGWHYLAQLDAADGPVDVARCGGARGLFVDPLYQLARLQLLADASERERSLGCDRMILLVLVPKGNQGFRQHVPGPKLRASYPEQNLGQVWTSLLRRPGRFALATFDQLLARFPMPAFPALIQALAEVRSRYVAGRSG